MKSSYPKTSADAYRLNGVEQRVLNDAFDPALDNVSLKVAFDIAISCGMTIYIQSIDRHDSRLRRILQHIGCWERYQEISPRTGDNEEENSERQSIQIYLEGIPAFLLRYLPHDILERERKDDTRIGCTELCLYFMAAGYDFETLVTRQSARERVAERLRQENFEASRPWWEATNANNYTFDIFKEKL